MWIPLVRLAMSCAFSCSPRPCYQLIPFGSCCADLPPPINEQCDCACLLPNQFVHDEPFDRPLLAFPVGYSQHSDFIQIGWVQCTHYPIECNPGGTPCCVYSETLERHGRCSHWGGPAYGPNCP